MRSSATLRERPELALFGDAIICLRGVLLFGGALAFFAHKKLASKQSGLYVAPILGFFYTTLPNLLYWSRIDLSNALFWIFVVAFPITSARLTVRRVGAEDAGSSRLPDSKVR
jgi:hypothetical protein